MHDLHENTSFNQIFKAQQEAHQYNGGIGTDSRVAEPSPLRGAPPASAAVDDLEERQMQRRDSYADQVE